MLMKSVEIALCNKNLRVCFFKNINVLSCFLYSHFVQSFFFLCFSKVLFVCYRTVPWSSLAFTNKMGVKIANVHSVNSTACDSSANPPTACTLVGCFWFQKNVCLACCGNVLCSFPAFLATMCGFKSYFISQLGVLKIAGKSTEFLSFLHLYRQYLHNFVYFWIHL